MFNQQLFKVKLNNSKQLVSIYMYNVLARWRYAINGYGYGVYHNFQKYFGYIVLVSLLVEENGMSGENHRSAASQWQTLSHNVVSSTHRHERRQQYYYFQNQSIPEMNHLCVNKENYLVFLF